MLTLFHAPFSRSSRVIALLHALGAMDRVEVRPVSVRRQDGSGAPDPANPHPEGKVPYLLDGGAAVWESPAVILHLTDRFPGAGLGFGPDDPLRGTYVSWLVWYGTVMEPVMILEAAGLRHPLTTAAIRGMPEALARLTAALERGPWIMGGRYTAVDLLLASAFLFYRAPLTDHPAVRDWVARCGAQPCLAAARAYDEGLMAPAA